MPRPRTIPLLALGAILAASAASARQPAHAAGEPSAAPAAAALRLQAPPPAKAAFQPPPIESLTAERLDAARMQQTVRDLVKLGPRMGGTPSGDRAAAYLAAAFERAGLPARTVEDPPAPAHWEDGWSVELAPPHSSSSTNPGPRRLASAWPYGFSPSVGPVEAPLAVLSGALTAEVAARPHPEWRGKVLYVAGQVRAGYTRLAARPDRPLALLTSAPNDGQRYLDAAYLEALPAMPGRATRPLPVFGVSYEDGRALAATPADTADTAGTAGAVVRVMLRSTIRPGSPRTVIADLPGRDTEHYYLICAHGDSDSGGPGADDNASGEAVVLEVAQTLARLVREGRLAPPRVTLRFAIWGSEYASSGAYVAREGPHLARCLGVLNLDEEGTGAERNAIYFESNEIPWNRTLLRTLDRIGADYAGRPGFWPEYTTNPSQGGTDSYAFLPKRYQGELASNLQIPATTIYTAAWDHLGHLRQTAGWESPATSDPIDLKIDYSRYYHSSGDTPENTTDRKPEALERAARAVALALLRLVW
jgi:hypothetical protein